MQYQIVTTVVTPASNYDLVDLDVVKDELSIPNNDISKDETLGRYIAWASAALSQECNRVFQVETVKDEVWAPSDGMGVLQLSRFPIISVTSIIEGDATLVLDTDFKIDKAAGQVLRVDGSNRICRWSACPIAAIVEAGFAAIPGGIVDAVTRMVRNRFRAKGRDTYLVSESIPGVRDARWWIATGNEAGNMPPDIADLVENYRVPIVA